MWHSANLRFFGVGQSMTYSYTYFSDVVARFNGTIWGTSWIGSFTDERIKKDIQDLDDNEMLNKLMLTGRGSGLVLVARCGSERGATGAYLRPRPRGRSLCGLWTWIWSRRCCGLKCGC